MNFDRIRELLWEQTFHSSKLSSVLVMLEEVGKFISGRTPKSDELASIGDIPYFKVGDMNTEGNEKFLRITSLFLKEKAGKTFPAGAIVYPKNGGAVFTNKRRILATESVIDLNTGGFVCGEKLNQAYAYMFFCGLDFRKISKGTALPTIDQKKLHRTKIPVPSLEEQSSIVTRLEEAFAEIDRAEKAYEELQMLAGVLKGQILQEAVQGKLVPQLAEEGVVEQIGTAPEEVLFEIPGNWKWTRMSSVVDVRDGTHDTPKYGETGVPFVTSKNLKQGAIDFSTVRYISQEDHEEFIKRSKVDAGDILMAMIGTIGNALIVPKGLPEFSIKNIALLKKKADVEISFSYVLFVLKAFEQLMDKQSSGSVQKFVSLNYLRNMPFPVPPLKEQERIVNKVQELMRLVEALSSK